MRGHEEASGIKYVPKKLLDAWAKRDPLARFEKFLDQKKLLSKKVRQLIREALLEEIERSIEQAFAEPEVEASIEQELADVYAPAPGPQSEEFADTPSKELRFVDAISEGLREGMRRDAKLIVMGQDVAEYGGVFKVTQGFVEEFGKERVRNTPICESAILGAALGLSIKGIPSVVEMQFADFVTSGFNQVINNLAKVHYRWGQAAQVVVRMPTGAGTSAGPFHSQSNEAWFTHTPGLRVVYPSNPYDAKGLLLSSLAEPNPVMFFEHKALYRSVSSEVPSGYYTIPLGKAALVRSGEQAVIITYGAGVHWATRMLAQRPDISVAVLDLRTLAPLDYEAIDEQVRQTGRVLILHEDTLCGGFGGEIAAYVAENLFGYLDAPVVRVGSLDTAVPFAPALEQQFLAASRLERALHNLLVY
jgi:2-oxoisovalerate dehydrogenase E1 component